MIQTLSRRALYAAAAVTLLAGCSGNSGSVAPNQTALLPQSRGVGVATRILPGPDVVGPLIVPLVPDRIDAPLGWPAATAPKQILFVSASTANEVLLYNPRKANPTPEGSISSGLDVPFQLAVDSRGTLYAANISGNTVTEYAAGSTSPTFTISSEISGPYGVTVDSEGNVFVSNLNNNTVTAYKRHRNKAYETISFSAYGQAVGLGVDSKDNVYVACDSSNAVYVIPKGSSQPQNAGLSGLNGPVGLSVGLKDVLYVANFGGSNVSVYPAGSTSPSTVITNGIEKNGPTLDGFTSTGSFFQSNQDDNVVGYKAGQTSPFSTITGLSGPTGIASSPLVRK